MREKGQTLVEMIAAVALVVLVVGALLGLGIRALRGSQFGEKKAKAVKLAEEAMEALRYYRDENGFEAIKKDTCYTFSGGEIGASGAACQPASVGDFSYIVRTEIMDANKVRATVTISWTDQAGTHEQKLVSYFTRWKKVW